MFYAIPNLSSHAIFTLEDPATLPSATPLPRGPERTAWATSPETNHCFYSLYEGVAPNLRISKDNPAEKIHGIVGDYDSELITDKMIEYAHLKAPVDLRPSFYTRTMTEGRARAVWLFEESVFLPPEGKVQTNFIERVAKELNAEHFLPGFDPASVKTNQYFELGSQWAPTPAPRISTGVVMSWMMDSARKSAKVWGEGKEVPLDVVAAEVEAKWPGRWKGSFDLGLRGPVFFVEPFEERDGCMVGSKGMICYSTRAGKSFIGWSELLGAEFMRKYEGDRMAPILENLFYDGKMYWWREPGDAGTWTARSKDDSCMHLKDMRFDAKVGKKDTISEVEKVLVSVQRLRTVDFAAPMLFRKEDICYENGDKILNISRREVMPPAETGAPSEFPWIYALINNAWDDYSQYGVPQRDYFLAWFKRLWKSALNGNLAQGQLLVIAGAASSGKTFLNRCIVGEAMGGSCDAADFLQGNTSFNKQAAECAVWRIDDGTSSASSSAQTKFSETLKKHVANPTALYHPKFKDSQELPWKGRIVITCNTDPDSLSIIPPFDNSSEDKVMLLRFSDDWKPEFSGKNEENEAIVRRELPHFLKWLHDWKTPEACRNIKNPRYGIKPLHHPAMLAASLESSTAYSSREALELWRDTHAAMNEKEDMWVGTATQLLDSIQSIGSGVLRGLSAYRLGKDLRKLQGKWGPLDAVVQHGGIKKYRIKLR